MPSLETMRKRCVPEYRKRCSLEDIFTIQNTYFLGYKTMQTWSALYMLENILDNNQNIKRIVDIGTGCGGTTLFFGLHMMVRNGQVLSFDIYERQLKGWSGLAEFLNVSFINQNVFTEQSKTQIQKFIKDDRALVFCDGGKKTSELNIFSKIIKPNDLLLVHDLGKEIKWSDIEKLEGVELYRQIEFNALKTKILSLRKK